MRLLSNPFIMTGIAEGPEAHELNNRLINTQDVIDYLERSKPEGREEIPEIAFQNSTPDILSVVAWMKGHDLEEGWYNPARCLV